MLLLNHTLRARQPSVVGVHFYMRIITIKSPKHGEIHIKVDDDDYDYLSQFHWTVTKNKSFYAKREKWANNKPTKIYMHREIMGLPDGIVDHKDCDTTNNQKSNLRIVNSSNSQKNRRKQINSTCGHKGVSYYKAYNKYSANLGLDYKNIFGGYYDTIIEAALAYNQLAIKYYGEYANLNVFNEEEQCEVDILLKNGFEVKEGRRYEKKYPRGVSLAMKPPPGRPYTANVMVNKKRYNLGYFKTEIEAAMAYNEGLRKYGGDLRKLNKIPE